MLGLSLFGLDVIMCVLIGVFYCLLMSVLVKLVVCINVRDISSIILPVDCNCCK